VGRVVLDEWHVRVEIDDRVSDPEAHALIQRFAELVADAARSIEDALRAVGGVSLLVSFDR
jgi:hypothetical protein